MYEPKYRLNKRDSKRWHDLLVRHCLEAPGKDGKVKRHKKYPPLTPAENVEFEALDRKRSRKHAAHPIMKAARRRSYRQTRKLERLAAELDRMMKRLKLKVDRKG